MHLPSSHINLVGRPTLTRDSSYSQEIRLDHDLYTPEGPPRSRRSRRSRSASPRTSRVRDSGVEEVARHDAVARRRPRDPETDTVISEVETKRRRLDGLREPDRPSPSNASQYPSAERNESLHGFPIGESRTYYELEVPRAVSIDRLGSSCSFAGQKRPPLPPQKSLYKESMNTHVREPPPAQLPETNGPLARQNGPDPAGRSRNPESQPPSGPGGRRGRGGDSRKHPRAEPMDVDLLTPAHPPRIQESRGGSNLSADRDDARNDLPRGPKAMTSKLPSTPLTSLPPKPTTVPGRYSGRSPPPHLTPRDERPQRAGDRAIVDPHSDSHRDIPREYHVPDVAPPRRRSPDSVRIFYFQR